MKQYNVHVVFDQPVLGTANADPMIHERFIASKAPDAPSLKEEVAALGADKVEERGTTIFPKTKDGNPFLWDYQVKGYLKDACGFMAQATGSRSAAIPTYRSKIDGMVFVSPRNIRLNMPEGEVMRIMQRPLRAQTMQGPRVALASSEMVPAGTTCDFTVTMLADSWEHKTKKLKTSALDALIEWLAYGQLRGMGQWRNAGWGAFRCSVTDAAGNVIFTNLGE